MKKIVLIISLLSLIIQGCVSTEKKVPNKLVEDTIAKLPKKIPVYFAPKNTADGEFVQRSSTGKVIKSYVKNGKLDRYVDIYYPNNKLHSHTPLIDGLANGWSVGYAPDGRIRTKFLYKNGTMVSYILYSPSGNIIKKGSIK